MLARKLGQSFGLFARFQKEGFWREEAEHRFALLGAPVEIEGDGDGADFGEREEGFEMLGAAAAGEADQVAFADTLSEQVIRQPIRALVEFADKSPCGARRRWRVCRESVARCAAVIRRCSWFDLANYYFVNVWVGAGPCACLRRQPQGVAPT